MNELIEVIVLLLPALVLELTTFLVTNWLLRALSYSTHLAQTQTL